MDEVRVGMAVRDASGKKLGKVSRVYPWGFEAVRRFWSPYQWVFRYGEVNRIDGDTVEVARGQDDLLLLAGGGLPESWRRQELPFGGSVPAAPAEVRVKTPQAAQETGPLSSEEERRSASAHAQPGAAVAATGHPHR
jgi:hypothetical protein